MLTIFPSVSRSGSGDFLSVAVLSSCGANCCSVTGSVPQFWHWYFQYFSKPADTHKRQDGLWNSNALRKSRMDKHLPILGGKYQYQYLRSLALDTGQDIGCHKISHLSTQTGKEEIMFRIYIYLFIFYPVTCKCGCAFCCSSFYFLTF